MDFLPFFLSAKRLELERKKKQIGRVAIHKITRNIFQVNKIHMNAIWT